MGLIPCPACSHEVSEHARTCPSCGHPVAPTTPERVFEGVAKLRPGQAAANESARAARLMEGLDRGKSPRFLGTINGIGVSLLGRLSAPGLDPVYVTAACGCLFYIPVLPLGFYLVKDAADGSHLCYGRIKPRAIWDAFGVQEGRSFMWSVILQAGGRFLILAAIIALIVVIRLAGQ